MKSMETRINGSEGWRMADSPAEFIEANLANIAAFSIEIERIVGKSKLSQNREPVDHEAVRHVMGKTATNALPAGSKYIRCMRCQNHPRLTGQTCRIFQMGRTRLTFQSQPIRTKNNQQCRRDRAR